MEQGKSCANAERKHRLAKEDQKRYIKGLFKNSGKSYQARGNKESKAFVEPTAGSNFRSLT